MKGEGKVRAKGGKGRDGERMGGGGRMVLQVIYTLSSLPLLLNYSLLLLFFVVYHDAVGNFLHVSVLLQMEFLF